MSLFASCVDLLESRGIWRGWVSEASWYEILQGQVMAAAQMVFTITPAVLQAGAVAGKLLGRRDLGCWSGVAEHEPAWA